jgi:hypothetical protein
MDPKIEIKDVKSENKDVKIEMCTIIFKNNEKTKLPKSMIIRFGLLNAQEVKDNIYNLHTVSIEDFMKLFDNIYSDNNTNHLALYGDDLILYDYLDTDQDRLKNKKQFMNMIVECFHNIIISTKHGENILNFIKEFLNDSTEDSYTTVGDITILVNNYTDPSSCTVSMQSDKILKIFDISPEEYKYFIDRESSKDDILLSGDEIIQINKNGIKYSIQNIINVDNCNCSGFERHYDDCYFTQEFRFDLIL